jgi:CheY-like chemotaxis protein
MPRKQRIIFCSTNSPFGRRFNEVARRLKYEPSFAPTVEEAWELIQGGQHFDLIICDHKPPKLDGLVLLKRIRDNEATVSTPFVLYTSDKDEDVPPAVAALGGVFVPQRTEDQWEALIPQWLPPKAA